MQILNLKANLWNCPVCSFHHRYGGEDCCDYGNRNEAIECLRICPALGGNAYALQTGLKVHTGGRP